jgi:hypothetical protein
MLPYIAEPATPSPSTSATSANAGNGTTAALVEAPVYDNWFDEQMNENGAFSGAVFAIKFVFCVYVFY